MRNFDVELDPITIKFVVVDVQKIVTMFLEFGYFFLEIIGKFFHSFKVVFFESLELLDVRKNVDEFVQSSHEGIEFVEDLTLREIEALSLGHFAHLFFGVVVAFFVSLVELNA